MIDDFATPADIEFFKRRTKLNRKKAKALIADFEQAIEDLRGQVAGEVSRIEKNRLYLKIDNRRFIIEKLNEFLKQ